MAHPSGSNLRPLPPESQVRTKCKASLKPIHNTEFKGFQGPAAQKPMNHTGSNDVI